MGLLYCGAGLIQTIPKKIKRLNDILQRLDLIPETVSSATATNITTSAPASERVAKSNRVFVVHGRDKLAKSQLESLLYRNGLEPIVLHRQTDGGRTVIEKFEKHAGSAAFAIVLLTPDEIAYLASEEPKADGERDKKKEPGQTSCLNSATLLVCLGADLFAVS